MEYSISELSALSGVTTRTLRWYDKIGLLSPSRTAESGYRFYGPREVTRLQDILFYRALGVELAQIKACLDDPSFDRKAALQSHLEALQAERARLDALILSVRETIGCEERNETMDDEKKFAAFKTQGLWEEEHAHGSAARALYGEDGVDAVNSRLKAMTATQFARWQELDAAVKAALQKAVQEGQSPESEAGKSLAQMHRDWLRCTGMALDAAKHRGIAALYPQDEGFCAYYGGKACAVFLRDAVNRWADA